jgi:hypothetical protein
MALGDFKLFQFKNKEQREKEENEYAVWAFPYGDLQRENLTALIHDLKPKVSIPIYLASFLTCKEIYESTLKKSDSREQAIDKMLNELKSYNQLIKPKEMPMYLALVLADADLDESCEYPPIDIIKAKIQEFEGMKKKSIWKR